MLKVVLNGGCAVNSSFDVDEVVLKSLFQAVIELYFEKFLIRF